MIKTTAWISSGSISWCTTLKMAEVNTMLQTSSTKTSKLESTGPSPTQMSTRPTQTKLTPVSQGEHPRNPHTHTRPARRRESSPRQIKSTSWYKHPKALTRKATASTSRIPRLPSLRINRTKTKTSMTLMVHLSVITGRLRPICRWALVRDLEVPV